MVLCLCIPCVFVFLSIKCSRIFSPGTKDYKDFPSKLGAIGMREPDRRGVLSEIKHLFAHHPREDHCLNLILWWYAMIIMKHSYKLVKSNLNTVSKNRTIWFSRYVLTYVSISFISFGSRSN